MSMTLEKAIRLHKEMWSDMQKELGDNPNGYKRYNFKYKWLKMHGFGGRAIECYCFLCEYAAEKQNEELKKGVHRKKCAYCLIDWSELTPRVYSSNYGYCIYTNDNNHEVWETAPISRILELPERVDVIEGFLEREEEK